MENGIKIIPRCRHGGVFGLTASSSAASLRWYYPDQVQRVTGSNSGFSVNRPQRLKNYSIYDEEGKGVY